MTIEKVDSYPPPTCEVSEESPTTEKASKSSAAPLLTPAEQAELDRQVQFEDVKASFIGLYKFATPLDIFIAAVSTLCAMIAGATVPVGPIVAARLYLTFTNVQENNANKSLEALINRYTLYFVALALTTLVAWLLASFGFIHTGSRITRRIKTAYLDSVLKQNMAVFDAASAGDMLSHLTADTNLIQDALSSKLAVSLGALGNLTATIIVCFSLDYVLSFMTLSSMLVGCAVLYIGGIATARFSGRSIDALSSATAVVEEGLGAIKSTTALSMHKFIHKSYMSWLAKSAKSGYRLKMLSAVLIGICVSCGYLNVALAFWQGSIRLADGITPYANVIAITMVVKSAAFFVLGVGANMESFTMGVAAASRLLRMIRRPSPIDSSSDEGLMPDTLAGNIELRNIKLVYPSRQNVCVLDNVSINFPAGKTTGIVGQSGSGKSSIASILMRFYDPLAGSIFVDGINLSSLNLRWLRRHIHVVTQEPFLFNKSVYENISYGFTDPIFVKLPDEDKRRLIYEAARIAQAHDFVTRLPHGYETIVGPKGSRLSGGQVQRIAIARALVGNPRILILDEATSALDTETEARLLTGLSDKYKACTKIVIAHRLSTIRDANQIVVLRKGHLVETGVHKDLMAARSYYYDLVSAQDMSREDLSTMPESVNDKGKEKAATASIALLDAETVDSEESSFLASEVIGTRRGSYSIFTLLRFGLSLNKSEWYWVVLGLFLSILAGVEEPASAILFGEAVSAISLNLDNPGVIKHNGGFYAWFYFLLAIAMFVIFCGQGIIFAFCSEKMVNRARCLALQNLLRMDVAFFDRKSNSAGALASFLQTSTRDLEGVSGNALSVILICVSTLFCGIIVAYAYGWKLASVCLALMPFSIGSGYLGTWLVGEFERHTESFNNEAAEFANETLTGIRTVAAMTREGEVLERFKEILDKTTTRALKANLQTSFLFAIANSMVFSWTPSLGKAKQASAMLLHLLDQKGTIDPSSTLGNDPGKPQGQIEFESVTFAYQSRPSRPALNNLSLKIAPGSNVAFVGETGAGKSTIIAMIERFYDPNYGRILLDSTPITHLNVSKYRQCIGLVNQEPTLFNGTIRENLVIGLEDEGRVPSDAAIERACKQANIYDYIMTMPNAFDTEVGNRGSQLSVGQKQRVALARALIRQPSILLLDEATSSLDSESEALIQDALEKARKGRTTITIAHRLSTIIKSDKIFVLHEGSIAEAGTHAELMALKGRYHGLFIASTTGQIT